MCNINIESVIEILNSNLDDIDLTVDDANENLLDFGMESLSFIRIILSLEEEFDCIIPDSKLVIGEMNTANKLLTVLKEIKHDSEVK